MVVSGMSEDNTVNQKLNSLGPLGTRVLKLSLPFLIIALYLVILRFLLSNDDFMTIAGLMFLYVIPPAGKETIIPIGVSIWLLSQWHSWIRLLPSLWSGILISP